MFLIGTSAGGTGAHVRMLASGLAGRGTAVRVGGPARTGADLGLDVVPGVRFTPVEFGDRPRAGDVKAVLGLRRMLTALGSRPEVVHAHGMRAGGLAALALSGKTRRPRLVVTVHNAPPSGRGAARLVYLVLERIVARRADLVLAVSSDLERRMRAAGARQVARAVAPAPVRPGAGPDTGAGTESGGSGDPGRSGKDDRPLVLAVGRLAPQKDFGTLIDAARSWQSRVPKPRLVIAGDGPLEADLRGQAADQGVDAEFPGRVDNVPELLTAADVFVLPSRWEGQPLVLQEALRAGVPIVATRTGGIPDLTGDGAASGAAASARAGTATGDQAALLVPSGDPRALAEAVTRVLSDPVLAARLRAGAAGRAKSLPAEGDAVAAVLDAYASVLE